MLGEPSVLVVNTRLLTMISALGTELSTLLDMTALTRTQIIGTISGAKFFVPWKGITLGCKCSSRFLEYDFEICSHPGVVSKLSMGGVYFFIFSACCCRRFYGPVESHALLGPAIMDGKKNRPSHVQYWPLVCEAGGTDCCAQLNGANGAPAEQPVVV